MKKMKLTHQLLQFAMLSLLAVVSVAVTANESFAALDCSGCHGTTGPTDYRPLDGTRDPATGSFAGSHRKHLGSVTTNAGDCSSCHNNAGTGTPNTATYASNHRDGKIQLSTSQGYTKAGYATPTFFNQTSVPVLGSCSTASCHNTFSPATKATPTWGSAGSNCDTCHDATPATGKHSGHLTTSNHKPVCNDCHGSATHLNTTIEVSGYSLSPVAKHAANTYSGTCSATYCHSSGQGAGASATPVYAAIAPTWADAGTASCGSCHATTGMATGSHAKHLAKDTNCGTCHNGATATTYAAASHVDVFINVSGSVGVKYSKTKTFAPGSGAYGSCSNASCHAPFTDTAPVDTNPMWGAAGSLACTGCHNGGGGPAITTGAHVKHNALSAVQAVGCTFCHTAGTAPTHANGTVNVTMMAGGGVAKHLAGDANYNETCTTLCHTPYSTGGVTPNWGIKNSGGPSNCNLCHESNPTTGVHQKHLTFTRVTINCSSCHTNATTTAGGDGHGNNVIDVIQYTGGNVARHASGNGNYTATCTTTCHNPYSAATPLATPTWGTVTAACASCHNNTALPTYGAFEATGGPGTGSHSKHLAHTSVTCASCHSGASTSNGGSNHLDGNVDVTGYSLSNITKHNDNTYTGTCAASCHNTPTITTSAKQWGQSLDCSGCHGYPPNNTDHSEVVVAPGVCNGCHNNVTTSTEMNTSSSSAFVNLQLHMNGNVEGGKCNVCHGYPPVKTIAAGTAGFSGFWSSAKLQSYSGAGGVHNVEGHIAKSTTWKDGWANCTACHPSTQHNTGFGIVSSSRIQVVVDTQYRFDNTSPIVYSGVLTGAKAGRHQGTCSNVSCHFRPSPNWAK